MPATPDRTPPGAGATHDPGADHLLEIEDLSTHLRTARGVVRAVDRVTLRVRSGATLGIVGESGCGKSMLLRSILGLLPGRTAEMTGQILFQGRDLRGLTAPQMRRILGREIGYVSQDPMTSLNPVLTVGQQVAEVLRCHLGLGRSAARAEVVELLRLVGIPEAERRLAQYPHELSGGMRQRVSIAAALACGPKLLLADEPTTALDVTVQAQVLQLLANLARERSMAMILVTHDLGVVAGRSDQVAVMYAGRIVELAPTTELFQDTCMPYTEALLRSIPRLEDPPHHKLASIPGRPPDLRSPPTGCRFASRCAYARQRCETEEPQLLNARGADHLYACWYPLGSAREETPDRHQPTPVSR